MSDDKDVSLLINKDESADYGTCTDQEIVSKSKLHDELPILQDKLDKEEDKKTYQGSISLLQLFRYSTCFDVLLQLIGTLGAITNGCAIPLSLVLFSDIISDFSAQDAIARCSNVSNETFINVSNQTQPDYGPMRENAKKMSILATVLIVLSYFQTAFYLMASQRQTQLIRKKLFSSIMRQDIGWFDTYKIKELTSRLTNDVDKIKEGFGDKFA